MQELNCLIGRHWTIANSCHSTVLLQRLGLNSFGLYSAFRFQHLIQTNSSTLCSRHSIFYTIISGKNANLKAFCHRYAISYIYTMGKHIKQLKMLVVICVSKSTAITEPKAYYFTTPKFMENRDQHYPPWNFWKYQVRWTQGHQKAPAKQLYLFLTLNSS